MELKDFETALKRLEEIVSKLEEGMEISRFCGKKLDDAERRVEVLLKRTDGELSEEAFEPAGQAREGD